MAASSTTKPRCRRARQEAATATAALSDLVASAQGKRDVVEAMCPASNDTVARHPGPPARDAVTRTSSAASIIRAPTSLACGLDHARAPGASGPTTTGIPGLMTPAFSRAIASRVSAEQRLVIEVDRGDGGGDRSHDVRRVEPAAETHFENGDVDPARRKSSKADRRRALEEGRRRLEHAVAHQAHDGAWIVAAASLEVGRRHFPFADDETLFDPLEVRRGVAAGAVSGGAQRRARPSP